MFIDANLFFIIFQDSLQIKNLLEPFIRQLVSILKLSVAIRELLHCIVGQMDVLVINVL